MSLAPPLQLTVAHLPSQPSPLANKLTQPSSVSALFEHALAPGHTVLVPALDVCCALVEPRRMTQMQEEPPSQEVMAKAKVCAGQRDRVVVRVGAERRMVGSTCRVSDFRHAEEEGLRAVYGFRGKLRSNTALAKGVNSECIIRHALLPFGTYLMA